MSESKDVLRDCPYTGCRGKILESELAAAKACLDAKDPEGHFRQLLEANWDKDRQLAAKDAEIEDLKAVLSETRQMVVIEADKRDAEIERLRGTIGSMISACGLPDPVEGCRTAIEWGNEGLKDHIGDANEMIKDGE